VSEANKVDILPIKKYSKLKSAVSVLEDNMLMHRYSYIILENGK